MNKTLTAGVAAVGISAAALLGAGTAAAGPKLCANHGSGSGHIYIAACATVADPGGGWDVKDHDNDGIPNAEDTNTNRGGGAWANNPDNNRPGGGAWSNGNGPGNGQN